MRKSDSSKNVSFFVQKGRQKTGVFLLGARNVLWHALFNEKKCRSQDLRIIHVGKELRQPLVQTSPQSGINYESRGGCSGLFSVKSGKIPRMETALPLWETWPTAGLLHNESRPLMSILNLSCFNLTITSYPSTMCHSGQWLFPLEAIPSKAEWGLPSKGKCSSSDHLGEHLLNLLVLKHLLCAGRYMGFNKLWEEESNHFPG